MRGRITYEGILNKREYLSNIYLCKGANKVYKSTALVDVIAQYSGQYVGMGGQYSAEQGYEEEMLQVARHGTFCGLWQLFQGANVLGRPIRSLYPITNSCVKVDIQRMMHPLNAISIKKIQHILCGALWGMYRPLHQITLFHSCP